MRQDLDNCLLLVNQFVAPIDQLELMKVIDQEEWSQELSRRVQHYGFAYDYKKRRLAELRQAAPFPAWARAICARIREVGGVRQDFNQLIVNEYLPGQGITAHVDSPVCFDNQIVSISLGSRCVMRWSRGVKKFDILLEPGDFLLMQDDARYSWRHEIMARKNDIWEGRTFPRERRLSLTFRRTLEDGP